MKITDVRFTTYDLGKLAKPFRNSILVTENKRLTLVEVDTDEGISGLALSAEGSARFAVPIRDRLVGEDPRDYSRLWHRMFTGWRKPVVKGDAVSAIGSVDNALWDLRGKTFDLPVYRLLGGFRSRVPAYAAGGYYEEGKGPADLAEEMLRFVGAGYRAVKMKVGGADIGEDVRRVAAVREAVGPDIRVMVDANNAWTSAEALKFGQAVEGFDLAWFEEPCWPDDHEGMARLVGRLTTPIATGEIEFTRWGFRDLIERRAVDIVQADPQTCGGLTEWVRIATLASAHHLMMAPHGNHYVGAHAVAAVDNGLIVESYAGLSPWQDEFLGGISFVDGDLVLPETPGLGIAVDRAALERAARTR
ncbi:mandelate racemase/muconate lactonizing enzyme family protein [Actinopolymorpha sp. B9G3]|uniref:mandelate racemase/muconate lactonizing enzyme family protein n=1 Tax=Actinopolymorpha sp. B9G3 TaxID=3158970 RepID=UPI0032D97900